MRVLYISVCSYHHQLCHDTDFHNPKHLASTRLLALIQAVKVIAISTTSAKVVFLAFANFVVKSPALIHLPAKPPNPGLLGADILLPNTIPTARAFPPTLYIYSINVWDHRVRVVHTILPTHW